MIDHLTLTVRDVDRRVEFYTRALAPLGYRMLMEFERVYGFGEDKPVLWIKEDEVPTPPQHLAFVARRRADVDAFYAAALAAGARDNGPPGLREHYHPTYYAAFVIDPDGHPIEAVNHREAARRPAARRTVARRSPPRRAARKTGKTAKARKQAGAAQRSKRPKRR